jgi:hypothetical protein
MKAKTAIIILTIYLIIYICLFVANISISGFSYLLLIAPILLVLVVYLIIIDDGYNYPVLRKKEWGYKANDKFGLN